MPIFNNDGGFICNAEVNDGKYRDALMWACVERGLDPRDVYAAAPNGNVYTLNDAPCVILDDAVEFRAAGF